MSHILIDTHCHINLMVKKTFDIPLTQEEIVRAAPIVDDAARNQVTTIINVATSLIESKNCIALSKAYTSIYATIGIHPNDCTQEWKKDFHEIEKLAHNHESLKIVGVGECGIDLHYPDSNLKRQQDAFKAQIELALTHNLGLSVHSRDAADETLNILELYSKEPLRVIMHCFSYDRSIASELINRGYALGIGGTITYPKNEELRHIVKNTPLENIVLETDAPYLPIQSMRGKENHPQYIKNIAEFIAELRGISLEQVAQVTTKTSLNIFRVTKN